MMRFIKGLLGEEKLIAGFFCYRFQMKMLLCGPWDIVPQL